MAAAFIRITPTLSVAGQLTPDDVSRAAAKGFTHLVNNRPDSETNDQPKGSTIAEAAAEHGLGYTAIPVTHAGFTREMIEAMAAVLDQAEGPVLAFCRSGTRSTNLWALAEATRGGDPEAIAAAAAAGGYDVTGLMPALRELVRQRG